MSKLRVWWQREYLYSFKILPTKYIIITKGRKYNFAEENQVITTVIKWSK